MLDPWTFRTSTFDLPPSTFRLRPLPLDLDLQTSDQQTGPVRARRGHVGATKMRTPESELEGCEIRVSASPPGTRNPRLEQDAWRSPRIRTLAHSCAPCAIGDHLCAQIVTGSVTGSLSIDSVMNLSGPAGRFIGRPKQRNFGT